MINADLEQRHSPLLQQFTCNRLPEHHRCVAHKDQGQCPAKEGTTCLSKQSEAYATLRRNLSHQQL
jgi:hypothetical protein